jgi:hypothetical protein
MRGNYKAYLIKSSFVETKMGNTRKSEWVRNLLTIVTVVALSLGAAFSVGCSGSQSLATAFVQIQPGPSQVGTGGYLTVYAEAHPTDVIWSITAGTGCSGTGCGTLGNATPTSVTYYGPTTIPSSTATFTLTATSVNNPKVTASQTYTIYPVSVQISGPANSTVNPLSSAQFTATVAGDATGEGVSWSVSGPDCSGNGSTASNCGIIPTSTITSAAFTAPPAPEQESIAITATSVAFPGESASYVMTVPKLAVFLYTPTLLPAAIGGQPYSASVAIEGNQPPYTETFSNAPSWATVTPGPTGFTIAGTPPANTQGMVYMQANIVDSESPAAQGSQSFAIATYPAAATGNNLLKGSYAFYATGWIDGTTGLIYQGVSYIGSFTADGNGNITGGELDVNNFITGLTSYSSLGGTYNIQYAMTTDPTTKITTQNPNFQTGYITLVPPGDPSYPITLAVSFRGIQHASTPSLSTDLATTGDFIEYDDTTGVSVAPGSISSGIRTAGTLTLQSPSVLSQMASPFNGGYAFGMNGNTSEADTSNACYDTGPTCGPISLAGALTVGSTGNVTNGEEDVMLATNYSSAVPFSGSFGNNGSTDAFGRMTAVINTSATSSMLDWPTSYIVYAVDPQHFYIMSSDSYQTNANIIGTATQQNLADIASDPISTTVPMALIGTVTSTQSFGKATGPVGQYRANVQVFTAVSAGSTTYTLGGPQYQNASGVYTSVAVGSVGSVKETVAANGRVTTSSASEPILYLTDTSTGYGTQWDGGSGPGLWIAMPRTSTTLNAGNYSESEANPTSMIAPMEVGIVTIPSGGVLANSVAVPITGTDFTAFDSPAEAYSPNSEGMLYTGPIAGSLDNKTSFTYQSVTYTGIFGLGSMVFTPTLLYQACGQQAPAGGGFVVSPTVFICLPNGGSFTAPHIFQQ